MCNGLYIKQESFVVRKRDLSTSITLGDLSQICILILCGLVCTGPSIELRRLVSSEPNGSDTPRSPYSFYPWSPLSTGSLSTTLDWPFCESRKPVVGGLEGFESLGHWWRLTPGICQNKLYHKNLYNLRSTNHKCLILWVGI